MTEVSLKWYENFKIVNWVILLASSFCLIVHWLISRNFDAEISRSLLNVVLEELGLAGLIALILNLSIEWVNRKRHEHHQHSLLDELDIKHQETTIDLLKRSEEQQKETAKSLLIDVDKALFNRVYKRNIDESVFQQIEKHLLRADIMRRNFRSHFTVRLFPKDENLAVVEYVNDYRVFNVTNKPVNVSVVKAVVDVTPKYRGECKFTRITIGDEIFTEEQLVALVKEDDSRSFISLTIEKSVPPNDSIPVRIEYIKLAPADYVEVVITTVPMDGLHIAVTDPSEKFTIQAVSLHPESERPLTPNDRAVHKEWIIENAILPGQGIALLWHPTHSSSRTESV